MLQIKRLFSPKIMPLFISLIAAFFVVLLVQTYLKNEAAKTRKQLLEREKSFGRVLFAKEYIKEGSKLTKDMVVEENIPKVFIQPGAIDSLGAVENRVTAVPIEKGEQILRNKFVVEGYVKSLSLMTPPGYRAISITVDNISSLGGMIQPGDRVDVIGVVPVPTQSPDGKIVTQLTTMPLFQDVLILAVGTKMERGLAKPPTPSSKTTETQPTTPVVSSVITIALKPQEANLIAFVQEQQGKIRLILRSPQDTQVQQLAPASWDALIQYVYPQLMQGMPQAPEQQKKIEIYRGTKKDEVVTK